MKATSGRVMNVMKDCRLNFLDKFFVLRVKLICALLIFAVSEVMNFNEVQSKHTNPNFTFC